jgi:SAM-dependent methyltransferase
MTEFWERNFQEKNEMWGFDPTESARLAKDIFIQQNASNILIPGIGYGRNAKVYLDAGMNVTGIEISETAIQLAQKHFGNSLHIYHGSVSDMPFDNCMYDGIFSHALIHLLDKPERSKLLQDCYNQLTEGGSMIFTAVTKDATIFQQGKSIGIDRFEMFGGVNMFFYDSSTILEEFDEFGLTQITLVQENFPFHFIVCRK